LRSLDSHWKWTLESMRDSSPSLWIKLDKGSRANGVPIQNC
jgi:hypothetical protein